MDRKDNGQIEFSMSHHFLKYLGPNCVPMLTPDFLVIWRKKYKSGPRTPKDGLFRKFRDTIPLSNSWAGLCSTSNIEDWFYQPGFNIIYLLLVVIPAPKKLKYVWLDNSA